VKLIKLPPPTTEADVHAFFRGFPLAGEEVSIKFDYAFVWLPSQAQAYRAVETLDKRVING
jgi:RNA recognition motif-containing protein